MRFRISSSFCGCGVRLASRPVARKEIVSLRSDLPVPRTGASMATNGVHPSIAGRANVVRSATNHAALCASPANGKSQTISRRASRARVASSSVGDSGTLGNSELGS